MEYKYLAVINNVNRLKEDEISYKPKLKEILDLWINDSSYHTTNKDNIDKENKRIKRMFKEFKHYLKENKIDEPWIGLDKLGMFPLKWIK